MARKPSKLEEGLADVIGAALRDDSRQDIHGAPDDPDIAESIEYADEVHADKTDEEEGFDLAAVESNVPGDDVPRTDVTGLSGSLIDAEVRDNIEDATQAQDREIERTSHLLDLIDRRIDYYEGAQEQLNKLIANAKDKRKQVEAAHDAAQLARAMLNTKKARRTV